MNPFSTPEYSIEIWEHGISMSWTNPRRPGLPMDAFEKATALFPKNSKAEIDSGICSHYNMTGNNRMIAVIGLPEELVVWREKIKQSLQHLPIYKQWIYGTETGLSSINIFRTFFPQENLGINQEKLCGATPRDASDFERCLNLLEKVPSIRGKNEEDKMLFEAVMKTEYPNTPWVEIVDRWDELENLSSKKGNNPQLLSKILREINERNRNKPE